MISFTITKMKITVLMSFIILIIILACFISVKASNGPINEMFFCALGNHESGGVFLTGLTSLTAYNKSFSDDDVKFFLFKNEYPYPYQIFVNDSERLESGNFEVEKPTKIIIHGYKNQLESNICTDLKDAFSKSGDFNIIVVDWNKVQKWGPWDNFLLPYPMVVQKINYVANTVTKMIEFLQNYGMSLKTTTIVGHSLGAHVAGVAGYNLQSKIYKVVGLDPARPLFVDKGPSNRLSKESAMYVEVIHTEIKKCGLSENIGHYDFYPNKGFSQPGCKANRCSHARSYQLYAESIISTKKFIGQKCNDFKSMTEGKCTGNTTIMGDSEIKAELQGIFYLPTRDSSPFALNP